MIHIILAKANQLHQKMPKEDGKRFPKQLETIGTTDQRAKNNGKKESGCLS